MLDASTFLTTTLLAPVKVTVSVSRSSPEASPSTIVPVVLVPPADKS